MRARENSELLARELDLADRTIELLGRTYAHLTRRTYKPGDPRVFLNHALALIAASGIRHLRACVDEQRSGWGPESGGHVRTAWELAIDAAFLLSKRGTERHEIARQFLSMCWLRGSQAQEILGDPQKRKRLLGEHEEMYLELLDEFRGSPALKDREHWTGHPKSRVRRKALEVLDSKLGPTGEGFAAVSKSLLFDIPSAVVHADPSAMSAMPLGDRKFPLTSPAPELRTVFAMGAVASGLLLLFAISSYGTEDHRSEARALLAEAREVNELAVADGQ